MTNDRDWGVFITVLMVILLALGIVMQVDLYRECRRHHPDASILYCVRR